MRKYRVTLTVHSSRHRANLLGEHDTHALFATFDKCFEALGSGNELMSGKELAAYAAVTLEAELAGTEAGALKAGAAMERPERELLAHCSPNLKKLSALHEIGAIREASQQWQAGPFGTCTSHRRWLASMRCRQGLRLASWHWS